MAVKKSGNGACPGLLAFFGSVGISVMAGPVGLLSFPLIYFIGRHCQDNEMDEIGEADAIEIIEEGKRQGLDKITVVHEQPSNGALFDLPIRRTYTYTRDEE